MEKPMNRILGKGLQSMLKTIEYLKDSGLKIVCAAEKSGGEASDADLKGPVVLVMGSEEKGISRELLSLADKTIRIPMKGSIASLNVSVAAGILLYEIIRQRSSISR